MLPCGIVSFTDEASGRRGTSPGAFGTCGSVRAWAPRPPASFSPPAPSLREPVLCRRRLQIRGELSSRPAGGLPAREVCFGARSGDCLPDQRLPAPQSRPGSTRRPPASPLLQCAWNEGLSLQEVSLSPREDVFLPWSPEPCPFGPSQPHEKDGWLRSVHLEVGQVRQVRKAV